MLSVRGTLSLKDALTDMSPRMHKICECQRIHHKDAEGEQYIHVVRQNRLGGHAYGVEWGLDVLHVHL